MSRTITEPIPAPITAGAYLTLRRMTAGLTLAEVARRYAHHALAVPAMELLLEEAERGVTTLTYATLKRLRAIVPLDPEIYLDLAGNFDAEVCRGCGCSELDACRDGDAGGCAWADATRTICTACRPVRTKPCPPPLNQGSASL